MNETMENTIMTLVVDAGNARSSAMEAIYKAREGDFPAAAALMEDCNRQLSKAHAGQTDLIQREAGGEAVPVSLFLVHAQDHLMSATVVRDLAGEMIELYRRVVSAS